MNNEAQQAFLIYIKQYYPSLLKSRGPQLASDSRNIREFFNNELQKNGNNQIINMIDDNNGLITLPIMLQWIQNHHYQRLLGRGAT